MSIHNKLIVLLQYFFTGSRFGPTLDKNDVYRDADEIQHINQGLFPRYRAKATLLLLQNFCCGG